MEEDALQPHELAEKGLGPEVFGPTPPLIITEEVTPMAFNRVPVGGEYVAEEDVIETLPDGRQIQVAVKGESMPMADAVKAGLVKNQQQPGPAESKPAPAPAETKAAPAEEEAPAKPKADAPKK